MALKHKAAAGVRWTATSSLVTTLLQFGQLAILARLLSPTDFGLIAMITVVVGFAQAYADMGVSAAIIHRQDIRKEHLSSLYWLNVAGGATLFLVFLMVTPFVVLLYREPRLAGLMPWMGAIFLITPWGQQFQILMQKDLRFSLLARLDMVSVAAGVAAAILSAAKGLGVYSLVLGQLCNASVRAIILVAIGWRLWRPVLHFSRYDLKGYIGFGLYQMGERTITYFNSQVDQLLIGLFLGAQQLGYYTLAFNMVIAPVAKINPIVTKVALPIFAKMQSDLAQLKRGYLVVLNGLAVINFPLLIGLAVTAPVFVPLVVGAQWLPAVLLVQILAFVALMRSTGNPVGALLLAKGRADLGFRWNVGILLTQASGVFIGARIGGAEGVAISLLCLQLIYFAPNYAMNVRSLVGPCWREYLMSMAPASLISIAMGLPVAAISFYQRKPSFAMLAVQICCGFLLYIAISLRFQRSALVEIYSLIFSRWANTA